MSNKAAAKLLAEPVDGSPFFIRFNLNESIAPRYVDIYENKYRIFHTRTRLSDARFLHIPTNVEPMNPEHEKFVGVDGRSLIVINYFMELDEVTDVVTDNIELGCSAHVYFTTKIQSKAPWGDEYLAAEAAATGAPENNEHIACLEKRNSGWAVKIPFWK